ncbi:MAG: GntP family permease [Lachnospiraceae bacterium]|nr:GntP family permease [Lachnospiraceae bacterium]MDD3617009.1 GntP family permease [Lachnospiraceae bacterium]
MIIGILLALILMMVCSMLGVSIIIVAPICAILAAITGGVDLLTAYTGSYMSGVAKYVCDYFPLFLLGAIFGELMKNSGAAASLARFVMRKLGAKRAILACMLATIVLVYGGVSTFCVIFALYPFMFFCFKEADIPLRMMPGVIFGGIIVTQATLPGCLQIQNIIPCNMLGVSLQAAPIMGTSAFLIMAVAAIIYLNWETNRLRKKGFHFEDERNEAAKFDENADLPNVVLSILPLITVVVLLNVFNFPAVGALVGGVILTGVLFFNRLRANLVPSINTACTNSMPAILNTACAVGFGTVIQTLSGFDSIVELIESLAGGNPFVFAFIAINILAGVTGSASGGTTIALNAVGERLLATGANPAALARVCAVSSCGLDSLPHNGAVITIINYCGQTHKKSYFPIFVVSVILPIVGGLWCVLLANLGIV